MPTSHWVNASFDVAFSAGFGVRQLDVNIPATATMKRFLLRGARVMATHSGIGFEPINTLFWTASVDIIAGQYSPRNIFKTSRAVPQNIVALYDVVTAQRVYTQYALACDNELSFNERTSYGTSGGPGMTVRCELSLNKHPGVYAFPDGRWTGEFRALYILP